MTRFLRAVILPLVLLSLTALNSFGDPVLVNQSVPVRRYLTATGGVDFKLLGTTGTAGFVDSTVWSSNNLTTAQQQETTGVFFLPAWVPVRCGLVTSASATADSAFAMRLAVRGVTSLGSTTSLDTTTATIQGSFDNGSSWMSGVAVKVIEPTGGNATSKWYTILLPVAIPAGTLTNATVCSAPSLRLILSCGSGSGQFECIVSHFADPILAARFPQLRF